MTLSEFKLWLEGYLTGANIADYHISNIFDKLAELENSLENNKPSPNDSTSQDWKKIFDDLEKDKEEDIYTRPYKHYPPFEPLTPQWPGDPWPSKIWCDAVLNKV